MAVWLAVAVAGVGAGGYGLGCWVAWAAARTRVAALASVVASRALMLLARARTLLPSLTHEH